MAPGIWPNLDRLLGREADMDVSDAAAAARTFLATVAVPALETVRAELSAAGYAAEVACDTAEGTAVLVVPRGPREPLTISVRTEVFHKMRFAFPAFHGRHDRPRHVRVVVTTPTRRRGFRMGRLERATLAGVCRESVRKWLGWSHARA